MDYLGILERSFAITRRHRALWVFGFLLALFSAGGGPGNGVQYTFQGDEFPLEGIGISPALGVFLVASILLLVMGLVILAIIVNYVCQTALIGLVGEIEEGRHPTVRHGFDVGWSRSALRLFGVDVVIFIPIMLVTVSLVLLFVLPLIALGEQGDAGPIVFFVLCCLALLLPLAIATAVAVGLLKTFTYRQVVLADDGVLAGIRHGYGLVRANPGPVAAMWLVMFVVGIVWAAVNLIVGLLAFAMVGGPAAFMYAIFRSGLAAVLGALPFLAVALLLFAVVNALYTVFTSTVWTLTYRELPNRPTAA